MSRFLKPNAQQIFGHHREAEPGDNLLPSYRQPSQFNPLLAINLWPSRSGFSTTGSWFFDGQSIHESVWFEDISTYSIGARSHYSIVGLTKDSAGTAMASVTLEAFTTADDIKQGECISNSGGEYVLPTQVNSAHYVRAYKVGGAFNYGGTSDQNLIPT